MLAKAISMQGDYTNQVRQAQQAIVVPSKEHMAILESLEFKISGLEQQLTVSQRNSPS